MKAVTVFFRNADDAESFIEHIDFNKAIAIIFPEDVPEHQEVVDALNNVQMIRDLVAKGEA